MKFECRKCNQVIDPSWQFCQHCGKKLPLKTNQKRLATAAQLAEHQQHSLANYRKNQDVIKGVSILTTPRACSTCLPCNKQYYPISELPQLPHVGCECEYGCGCVLLPVTKGLKGLFEEWYGQNPTEKDRAEMKQIALLAGESFFGSKVSGLALNAKLKKNGRPGA